MSFYPRMTSVLIEAAVDTLADALAAERAGADRIELCGTLHDGAITPSAGFIAHCVTRVRLPVHVFIRLRTGDFVYSPDEIEVMLTDVGVARQQGAAGVVIGALTRDHEVDVPAMRALTREAGRLTIGFHRAFDQVRDQAAALETLVELGVSIVLTSGGAPTAVEGASRLRALVGQAGERIAILAGGSVTPANVRALVGATGVRQVHGKAFAGLRSALDAS